MKGSFQEMVDALPRPPWPLLPEADLYIERLMSIVHVIAFFHRLPDGATRRHHRSMIREMVLTAHRFKYVDPALGTEACRARFIHHYLWAIKYTEMLACQLAPEYFRAQPPVFFWHLLQWLPLAAHRFIGSLIGLATNKATRHAMAKQLFIKSERSLLTVVSLGLCLAGFALALSARINEEKAEVRASYYQQRSDHAETELNRLKPILASTEETRIQLTNDWHHHQMKIREMEEKVRKLQQSK